MGLNQIYLTFWINILQDLYGQSSHFQVLMRFLKKVREAHSRISVGTCCQSWLARHRIASSPYFSEWGFSVWKIWKFRRLYGDWNVTSHRWRNSSGYITDITPTFNLFIRIYQKLGFHCQVSDLSQLVWFWIWFLK